MTYDPSMRLYQVAGGATTRFAYDASNVIAEYDASNNLQRRFVFDPTTGQPILWYEGTGVALANVRYLGLDEHGSVVSVSNSAGAKIYINAYDEYGRPQSTNGGRFQYTGQKWIAEAGLYDYKSRDYLPHLGIFAQTDPAGYADSPNLYAYVGGEPVNLFDPFGMGTNSWQCPTWVGSLVHRCDQNSLDNGIIEAGGLPFWAMPIQAASTGDSGGGGGDSNGRPCAADADACPLSQPVGQPQDAQVIDAGLHYYPNTSISNIRTDALGFRFIGYGAVEDCILFCSGKDYNLLSSDSYVRITTLSWSLTVDHGVWSPFGSINIATYACASCLPTWSTDVPAITAWSITRVYRIPTGSSFLRVFSTPSTLSPTAYNLWAK